MSLLFLYIFPANKEPPEGSIFYYPVSNCRVFAFAKQIAKRSEAMANPNFQSKGVWDDPGCQGMVHSVRVAS
jgi:hypothetical protein